MKKKFNIDWKKSKQARKQRKYRFNLPLNKRRKLLSLNLTKELRKKYGRRSFPLRKGDSVLVRNGKFKGHKGKILSINKKLMVLIDTVQKVKRDGTKINVPIHPSKLQITELNMDDKKRIESIGKKQENKAVKEEKNDNLKSESKKK